VKVKDTSVNIQDLDDRLKTILPILDIIYEEFKTELVITSGRDGKHGLNSLHYQGLAVDLRTWNLLATVVARIRAELGSDFEVILEKDHIHIEYDPKKTHVVG